MSKPDSSKFPKPAFPQSQRAALHEIIKRAEKHINDQRYELAQKLLVEAGRMEPENQYIRAISERVIMLQGLTDDGSQTMPDNGNGNPLTVTVGAEPAKPEPPLTEKTIRIRMLLTVASTLLDRGEYEAAYDSLLKAEDIDPKDPDVGVARAKIVSAYETSIRRKPSIDHSQSGRGDLPGAAAMAAMLMAKQESTKSPDSDPVLMTFEQRVKALQRQREAERLARERALWQKTSQKAENPPDPSPEPQRQKNGFINALLKGKLFS